MKNYIIGSVVLVSALLVGCGSDGGECCGGNEARALDPMGNPIVYNEPAAIIDYEYSVNSSQSDTQQGLNGKKIVINQPSIDSIDFSFSGKRSYDRDESNSSITGYDWNITKTGVNGDCTWDENSTSKSDINITCSELGSQNNELFIILTVTDDENQTAEANTTLEF